MSLSEGKKRPFCRRCLLEEYDAEGMYRSISEYIASLDASLRCDQNTYARRLSVCRECDHLNQGLCVLCGCYVEARAAKAGQRCPSVPKKW